MAMAVSSDHTFGLTVSADHTVVRYNLQVIVLGDILIVASDLIIYRTNALILVNRS